MTGRKKSEMSCDWQENEFMALLQNVENGRDWMDGPMANVDPDNVEQEVGNFWRGLYKLEKGFDGIASPKKIASKVYIAAWNTMGHFPN